MARHSFESRGSMRRSEARSQFAVNAQLVRRRSRRDIGLLVAMVALVATTAMVAVAGPQMVLRTVDSGAIEIVAMAGDRADIALSFPVEDAEAAERTAQNIPGNLPPQLATIVSDLRLTVIGGDGVIRSANGAPIDDSVEQRARFELGTADMLANISLTQGRLPERQSGGEAIEVALSAPAAEAAALKVGSQFTFKLNDRRVQNRAEPPTDLAFVVVGIIAPAEQAPQNSRFWADDSGLWTPLVRDATAASVPIVRVTALVAGEGLETIARASTLPFEGRIRLHTDPQRFTAQNVPAIMDELTDLQSDSLSLTDNGNGPPFDLRSDLKDLLATYPPQARAALAQMSVLTAGVLGLAAVVVLLLAQLIVSHREAALALERARGSSVIAVGARALLESAVVTGVGVLIGAGAAWLLLPGLLRDVIPLVAVAVVALAAVPVQSMLIVRSAWNGRREPANRRDRAQLVRRRATIRVVIELSIVVVALAAIFSLRQRGLLQTRTDGIDPFLAAAPVLLGFALTIVVMRVFPLPVRAVSSLGKRSRGALGLLGAVRARAAIAILPLLALTLGASVAITGGLLVDTVRTGQAAASWERVGADARIDVEISDAQRAQLRADPGVELVASAKLRSGVGIDFGTTSADVTVFALDEAFPSVIDRVPGAPSTESLRALASQSFDDGSLAAVVDESVAARLVSDDLAIYYGPRRLTLHVIGVTDFQPVGYAKGPFVYVDLDAVLQSLPEPEQPGLTLVSGPGAEEAIASLTLADGAAISRTEWIDQRRSLALVAGVELVMIAAAIAAAILCVVALAATVIAGARARGRALSMLRTLGMAAGLGWWLALAELVPVVVAAIVGGIATGVIIVVVLAPAVGLDVLAGGVGIPATSIQPAVLISVVIGGVALLVVGAFVEVLAHKRDKLSDVLRVGDSA